VAVLDRVVQHRREHAERSVDRTVPERPQRTRPALRRIRRLPDPQRLEQPLALLRLCGLVGVDALDSDLRDGQRRQVLEDVREAPSPELDRPLVDACPIALDPR
jgi:hypothetical protein